MVAEQHNAQLSILFADISGSTALYDKLGNERALQLITRTLDILILEMAKHQGTLIKTIGDEIMCTFPDVATAVIAAQAMQFALEGQSHANGHQIYVRIGIHYGDVIQESGDVFGDAVNVAARVTAITRARQILTTQAVVDMLPQELRHRRPSGDARRAARQGKRADRIPGHLGKRRHDEHAHRHVGIPQTCRSLSAKMSCCCAIASKS